VQVNNPGWASRRRALQAADSRETLNVKREVNLNHLTPHAARLTKERPSVAKGKTSFPKSARIKKQAKG
jgi:hypothetical protein